MANKKIRPFKSPQLAEVESRANSLRLLQDGESTKQRKKAWDRLPDEPTAHFEWFKAYRDLGKGRTYQQAAQGLGMTDVHGQFGRVATRQEWVERCRLYDEWIVDTENEAGNRALEQKALETGENWAEQQTQFNQRVLKAAEELWGEVVERRIALARGEAKDKDGNIIAVEPEPFELRDKDWIMFVKGIAALANSSNNALKKAGTGEDDFSDMPSDPSEWSESDLLRYRAKTQEKGLG